MSSSNNFIDYTKPTPAPAPATAPAPTPTTPALNNIWLKAITIALAVISSTMALSELFGHFVAKEPWYWIGLSALATAGLGSYLLKKESFEKVVNIAVTVTIVSVIMMAITTIWPSASIKGGKEWAEQRVQEREKKEVNKAKKTIPYQITVQTTEGLVVDRNGNLRANLSKGQKVKRNFYIPEGFSTPWLVIPADYYSFYFVNMETIIVEEENKKTMVHPEEYYNMGTTIGEKRIRFTALKGGANLIITIKKTR